MNNLLLLFILVLIGLCVKESAGFSITLDSSNELECFFHEATQSQGCSGTFEVISGDAKELIVTVLGPPPKSFIHFESKFEEGIDSERDLTEGSFQFNAETTGRHKMCFARVPQASTDITVAFNFRIQMVDSNPDYEYAGLNAELAELQEGLNLLRDHLSYMSQREDAHKNALSRIDIKVLCWSILESMILVGMAVWQIGYISSFFEIKRFL